MARHLRAVNGSDPLRDRVRVVLAADHAALRRTLRHLLDREEGVDVVAEADDTEGALSPVLARRPDVLVLDMRMLDGSMVERIERFGAQTPGTRIVVITMDKNQRLAEQALGAGASGFVLKDSAETELGDAVRSAARGVAYTSPRLAASTLTGERTAERG